MEAYLKSCIINKKVDYFIKEFDKENDPIYIQYGISMKHFTFHMMLIASLLVINEKIITDENLAKINIQSLNDDILTKSVEILLESLNDLIQKNPTENIVSLAKVKMLTDKILIKIDENKLVRV